MATTPIALAAHLAEHPFKLSDLKILLDWKFVIWAAAGVVLFLLWSFGFASAQEIDWHPAAKECQAQIEKQCVKIHGAGCGGWWDKTARCTIDRVWPGKVASWVVDAAIAQVRSERKDLCNICAPDPVAETIRRAIR